MRDQWIRPGGEHMNDTVAKLEAQAEKDGIRGLVGGSIIINREGGVLLVKRTAADFMPNVVELPSGGINLGESLLQGLRREAREEVGFEVHEVLDYVDSFDYLSQSGKPKRQFNFVVSGEFINGRVQLSGEHVDHYWVGPEDLDSYNVSSETQSTLRKFWRK